MGMRRTIKAIVINMAI